ncbi:bacillithiol system redox-active protein YtxJ [Flaviaesturariibacter aridisoli]|uniref:Bacillithiol system redox-active protein YtxJ n=1 Tax=Flaviaesturariibacter aridisoli TaxID=2545761 RepID=A0A4R4DXJ3_9BACT|nr:bacillithiol system redox-active protein YtxJ [Flaviaesturariibacter aridisoli]TCZ65685.1 bacillithiol system redox-active protein YtxJ [Flaviaesturariibacter aridisoli]
MQWTTLTSEEQLIELISRSRETPQVIFKHSTRCSISSVAFQRIDKAQKPPATDFWLLDVLTSRPLSQQVAQRFGVNHESPQVLVIKNGECVYDDSHLGISMQDIASQVLMA